MPTRKTIEKLADRYPFDEDEIEQLIKCHSNLVQITKVVNGEDPSKNILTELAKHHDDRALDIMNEVLPEDFGRRLYQAITEESSFGYETEGVDKEVDNFLEGVANCGRRGPREATRVLLNCCEIPSEESDAMIDIKLFLGLCHRLVVMSHIMIATPVQISSFLSGGGADCFLESPTVAHVKALTNLALDGKTSTNGMDLISRRMVMKWVDDTAPVISCALSTFIHNSLFPGKAYPPSRTQFIKVELYESSCFFSSTYSPLLFPLACMAPQLGGKWRRLYSFDDDGQSGKILECALLGYTGPTLTIIRTEQNVILGAFTASTKWKKSNNFFGDYECFLFQLEPTVQVFRTTGMDDKFTYCNFGESRTKRFKSGLGFGGTSDQPRLFIDESFENCTASFFDKTYETGNLLPVEHIEKFNVENMEVWGVGGDEIIMKALQDREQFRDIDDTFRMRCRVLKDKRMFLDDFRSGLFDSGLFKHREEARGRAEFEVDEEHGGYTL